VNGYLEDGGSLREAVQVMATAGLLQIIHGLSSSSAQQTQVQQQHLKQSEQNRVDFNRWAGEFIRRYFMPNLPDKEPPHAK